MTNAKRGIWTTEIDGKGFTFKFGLGTLMRVRNEQMSTNQDFFEALQQQDFEAVVILMMCGYNEAVRKGYNGKKEIERYDSADITECLTQEQVNEAFEVLFECEFLAKLKENLPNKGGESGKPKKTGKKQ